MTSKQRRASRLMLVCLTCSLSLSGCGGSNDHSIPRAAVSGSIVLDGKPLEAGIVRFVPTRPTSGPKTSVPVMSGHFEIPADFGPVVGSHRVEIQSTDDGGYPLDDESTLDRLRAAQVRHIEIVHVPAIYNSHSRLTANVVESGPNEFDFTLISPVRRTR
ncbi:MAG: hypothetical protein KDA86_13265 [Planctomycetaceae bacterium]|nr:hypothetical protein [Planctomycetaceae bacterium]